MSDFDEEAERERLREQFEQDKQKREASERMSELLLKGATMTNAHCDTCRDPIFRYEGQEFCPTCRTPVGETSEAAEQGEVDTEEPTPQDAATPRDAPDPTDASADATTNAAAADDGSDATAEPSADAAEPTSEPSGESPATPPRTDRRRTGGSDGGSEPSERAVPPADATPTRDETSTGESPGFSAATASLERTLARLSRAAENADDLARQREYLQAAREAAEALEAARRAR